MDNARGFAGLAPGWARRSRETPSAPDDTSRRTTIRYARRHARRCGARRHAAASDRFVALRDIQERRDRGRPVLHAERIRDRPFLRRAHRGRDDLRRLHRQADRQALPAAPRQRRARRRRSALRAERGMDDVFAALHPRQPALQRLVHPRYPQLRDIQHRFSRRDEDRRTVPRQPAAVVAVLRNGRQLRVLRAEPVDGEATSARGAGELLAASAAESRLRPVPRQE